MQTKALRNWAGLFSIIWMMTWFVLIHYVMVPRHMIFDPVWLWIFGLLSAQLIPGLLLAIAGLRCGDRVGRVCAISAIGLFLWFVWYGVVPTVAVTWQLRSK